MRDYKAIAKAIEKDTCKGQRYCDKGPGERRFQLFCSAENNATDTAAEGRFVYESDEYWECVIQSLECLLCERSVKDSDIAYFKKFGVAP